MINKNNIMKCEVKISDLGRDNFTGVFVFEGTIDNINEQILNECKKHLLSFNISCDRGKIFAGFRTVGDIKVNILSTGDIQ